MARKTHRGDPKDAFTNYRGKKLVKVPCGVGVVPIRWVRPDGPVTCAKCK